MPTHDAPPQPSDDLPEDERALVRARVAYFLSRFRPPPDQYFDDLLQLCLAHWWRQRARYDPSRGASRQTFLRHVVDNYLLDRARRWQAATLRSGTLLSLDHPAAMEVAAPTTPDTDPVNALLSADAADRRARLLALLTPRQHAVAVGLEQGYSLADLSRALGTPHSTLRDELRRIQGIFRRAAEQDGVS